MNTNNKKNKRQNIGAHLQNTKGSDFRKAWIAQWLDDPSHKNKKYKDAVTAYIAYKEDLGEQWAEPLGNYIKKLRCWTTLCRRTYHDLLDLGKTWIRELKNIISAQKATKVELIFDSVNNDDIRQKEGWIEEGMKYMKELLAPQGKTGKWLDKLDRLCTDFDQITNENEIVPELDKIIKHMTYFTPLKETNDHMPLYKYPTVEIRTDEIARQLRSYSDFVTYQIENGHPNAIKSSELPEK